MGQALRVPAVVANDDAAPKCRNSSPSAAPARRDKIGTKVPTWFSALVAELWPERQRAKMLQFITGTRSERTCRAWATEKEPRASVLALLLRSDHGWRVLKFIMHGSTATWWLNVQHGVMVAEAIRKAQDQRPE